MIRLMGLIPDKIKIKSPLIIWSLLFLIAIYLASIQGYWRHDAWIYTESEMHEIADGRYLAPLMHIIFSNLPPLISFTLSILCITYFLNYEFCRISSSNNISPLAGSVLSFSVFSPAILSQLHWPTQGLVSSLLLIASTLIKSKNKSKTRIIRALFVAITSMSILSSFAFFSLICYLPEYPKKINKGVENNERIKLLTKDLASHVIVSIAILIIGYIVSFISKQILVLFGMTFPASRLESIFSGQNFTKIGEILITIGRTLFNQWGESSLLILLSLGAIVFLSISRNNALSIEHDSWRNKITICLIALMIIIPTVMDATGSYAQRVVLSWCFIPTILLMLIHSYKLSSITLVGSIFLLIASIHSTIIGMYNFSLSSRKTRQTVEYLQEKIPPSYPNKNKIIVVSPDLEKYDVKYIYGGWPPFSSNRPWNPRLHRALEELGYNNHSFCGEFSVKYIDKLRHKELTKGLSANCKNLLEKYEKCIYYRNKEFGTSKMTANMKGIECRVDDNMSYLFIEI
ncbi:hypothetical protein [Prochlorococcus marinus]|uniref:hypothetical protein n=1 Tax=Prochlorococcus marinus TaxID=1219 RepID=UPI0007B3D6BA|nr:hypothetical protein [Prochlorococcus marinus]KZR76741.1 hypothetical protein PMIT1320_00650 [Prochlorococcus marinus str. MIT 1320]